jgi:hypothetical protein
LKERRTLTAPIRNDLYDPGILACARFLTMS